MRVAFDIDDTILVPSVVGGGGVSGDNVPHYEVIAVLRFFQAQGAEIILWSGSGMDWAKRWGEKFGLEPFTVRVKEASEDIDIAFDDCDVKLAKVNVKVKRIKNGISRAAWNAEKRETPEEPPCWCGHAKSDHCDDACKSTHAEWGCHLCPCRNTR